MAISLSNLKPNPKSKKRRKRVGRGDSGSDPGTYSGRGIKGQRARSGGKKGLKIKGMRNIIKEIPKIKGFSRKPANFVVVNIKTLEERFKDGDKVDMEKLRKAGLLKNKAKKVKILGDGELKKKLTVKAHFFSESAEKKIKKAGGKIEKIN